MTRWRALLLVLAMAAAACTSAAPTAPAPTPSPRATAHDASSPSPEASVGQSDTEWGRIWDALPPAFPRYPGSAPAEAHPLAGSGVFVAPADVRTVTTWYQAELERVGYSTLALSGPFEDGSMEIDSLGPIPECLVRTTIAPLGGETIVTILYGADCPL